MKRLLLALVALVAFAQSAHGQAYQDPDWLDGTVPARVWTTTPTNPTGSAPADAYEPASAAVVGFDREDWIGATDGTTDYLTTVGAERKFRTLCEPATTVRRSDFILGLGVAQPFGHPHQPTGHVAWDENSTYATARAAPSSTCAGGPLNSTLYIEPAMLFQLPSGVTVSVRPSGVTFYYFNGQIGDPQNLTWVRRRTQWIGGVNPSNYNDTARRAEYAAAGLLYPGGPDTAAGFGGFQCFAGSDPNTLVTVSLTTSRMKTEHGGASTTEARHLKDENGADPWGGNCTGTVELPGLLIGLLGGPDCWDRHNLQAPDGRGHMSYSATDAESSIPHVCPDDHAHIPQLSVKSEWRHLGFSEYGNFHFASDRMNPADTPADPTSLDPCRQVGPWFCNGATFHQDWGYGWDDTTFDTMQRECLGITVRGVPPVNGPAQCHDSQFSKYEKLAVGGASPDINMSGGCAVVIHCTNAVPGNNERYNAITSIGTDSVTIEHH